VKQHILAAKRMKKLEQLAHGGPVLEENQQRANGVDRTAVSPPKVRRALIDDYYQIAALETKYGFPTKSYDEWMAFWQENPVCKQWDGQWPIGWVLETDSREIVGWIGNIPSAYRFNGRLLLAATGWNWVVHAPYQLGYGMLLVNSLLRQRHVDLFISNSLSPVCETFIRHLGFSRVPVGDWDKSVFWIANHRGFTPVALKMKSVPWPTIIGYPVSALLTCWDWCHDWRMRLRSSAYEIEVCYQFDSRFDDFWRELQNQNENVLLAVRTRETLAWHFRRSLMGQQAWILVVSKGSRLTAYAIFDRQENPANGLQRLRLVDFQAHKGSEEALFSALSWMLQKCREEAIHALEVQGCWLKRLGLPRIVAPYYRTMSSWRYYYKANNPELSETLKDPRVWAPSSFDGEASL
jgi:hypothetical protein